jgi:hypothetical protein
VTSLSSDQLIAGLILLEDRPWAEIDHRRPLTKHGLARRLRPFRISPGTIWLGAGKTPQTGKGYKLEWFQDAFDRYLPPLTAAPDDPTVRSSGPAENKDFSPDSKPSGGSEGVMPDGLENGANLSVSAAPDDLTVANGEGAGGAENGADPEPKPAADGNAWSNGQDETNPASTPPYRRRLTRLDHDIIDYDQAHPDMSLDHLRRKFGRPETEIANLLGRMPP